MEEVSWREKSMVLWLREGDKYMRFFYKVVNLNRRNKSIESLTVNDQFYPIILRSKIICCNSILVCIPNSLVGCLNWMTFLLIRLLMFRLIGWRELLRNVIFLRQ
jgi:hypothetical protein